MDLPGITHAKRLLIVGCLSLTAASFAGNVDETSQPLLSNSSDVLSHFLSERRPGKSSNQAPISLRGNTQRVAIPTTTDLVEFTYQPQGLEADSDADGYADSIDAFPFDPNEAFDTDNDGIGNNADTDDDNDGTLDINDDFPFNPARTKPIQPLFPEVSGVTDFPNHVAGNQFEWIMEQLAAPSTSITDIQEHFVAGYDPVGMQNFFNVLRTSYPNAKVIEPINATARQAQVIIGDPTCQ